MSQPEIEYLTTDNIALIGRRWLPTGNLRAVLCLVHGLGEHCGRYTHIAEALSAEGVAVIGIDHRGHGRSGGIRGHVDGFEQYIGDIVGFAESQVAELGAELPLFLLGHSMGGLITTRALQTYGGNLAGAVISNPCLGVAVKAPALKVGAARLLSKLLPKLRLDNELEVTQICRDPEVVAAYQADPLVHSKISSRWYTSLLAAMEAANADPHTVSVPTLWILSGQDSICDSSVARQFAASLPDARRAVLDFPEAYHEAHNGPDKGDVIRGIVDWVEGQL